MIHIRPIHDEAAYDAALAEVEHYFADEPKTGTPEADHFAVLLDLITAYEARRWPIKTENPVSFIIEAMALTGKTQADLAALLGSRSRASEILSRKRHLTLAQIHRISGAWGFPAEALIEPYELSA